MSFWYLRSLQSPWFPNLLQLKKKLHTVHSVWTKSGLIYRPPSDIRDNHLARSLHRQSRDKAQGCSFAASPSSCILQNTGQMCELHQTEGQLLRSARQTSVKSSEAMDVWASLRVDHAFTLNSINRRPSALRGRLYMYCTSRICPCKKCWKARQPNSRSLASESESKQSQSMILSVALFSMCSCECDGMVPCHVNGLQHHYKD